MLFIFFFSFNKANIIFVFFCRRWIHWSHLFAETILKCQSCKWTFKRARDRFDRFVCTYIRRKTKTYVHMFAFEYYYDMTYSGSHWKSPLYISCVEFRPFSLSLSVSFTVCVCLPVCGFLLTSAFFQMQNLRRHAERKRI